MLLGNLNPFLLRNINRILIGLGNQFFWHHRWSFYLDICLEPKRIAYIECYEQGIIARMKESYTFS